MTAEYRFGVVAPFTGQEGASVYGENIKNAVLLAVDELNKTGGYNGRKLIPQFEDDQLQAEVAVAAVQKLASEGNIRAVIGPVASSSTIAAAKVAERSKLMLISPASTSNEISGMSRWVARTIAPDNYEAEAMARYCQTKGFKRVAIACVDNAGTKGPANVLKAQLTDKGGSVPTFEIVPQGQTDVRVQMIKLAKTQPDAVYLLGYALELGAMIRQFREQDAKTPILSFQVMEEPKVREIAGAAAEGIVFTTPTMYGDFATGKAADFIRAYRTAYGKEPGIFAANAYDAVYVLVSAEGKTTDGTTLPDAIRQIKQFNGASGVFDINEQGDSNQEPRFMTIKDGKLVNLIE